MTPGPYDDPEIMQAVQTTAHNVANRYRGYTNQEDIEQHLWEWVLKAPRKIARWREENSEENFQRLLGAVLFDEANHFGRRAKADSLGYRVGDEFYYDLASLKTLLPSVYKRDEWVDPPAWAKKKDDDKVRNGKALNEGFGWVATLSDISRGLSRISREDQRVLFERFALGRTLAVQAADEDAPVSTVAARVDASLRRLLDALGGPKWLSSAEDRAPDGAADGGWSVGRRAMSNVHALAVTDRQAGFEASYEGEF